MSKVAVRLPQPHELDDTSKLLEYATLAEAEGIDSLWLSESYGRNLVPSTTLAMDRTDAVEFGSGIINIFSRSPALVAMTAASLAEISDGRYHLGIGASGPAVVENFHGVEFERPLRRTREFLEIVRAYLSGEKVDYDGDIFDLSGFKLDPKPEYDVPIYVAALGEKNRQLTGEFADGWLPFLIPLSGIEDATEAVVRGAKRGDRTLEDVTVAPFVITCVSDSDPEQTRDIVRSQFSFYVSAMGDYYYNVVRNHGFADEAEEIRSNWHDGEREAAREAVTDDVLDNFTICGTGEEARETIAQYHDVGVDMPVANVPARYMSDDLIQETISSLTE